MRRLAYVYNEYILPYFKSAIELSWANIVRFLRVNLLFCALTFFANYAAALIVLQITYNRDWQEFWLVCLTVPVTSYFIGGLIYHYLSFTRGVSITTFQILRGYRWYGRLVTVYFVVVSFYYLFIRMLFDFFDYSLLVQVRIILGLCLCLYVLVRSMFVITIIIETNATIRGALATSFYLTRDRFWASFVFSGFSFGVFLAGAAALGVGVLVAISVFILAHILLYDAYVSGKPRKKYG